MSIVGAVIGGAVLLALALRFMRPGAGAAISRSRRSGDPADAIAAIRGLRASAQPDAYNQAIRQLWDAYERELAAKLIVALGADHPDENIAQYWLDQLQRVEPEIAAETLERDFLEQTYKPEVAARCGSFG